MRRRRSLAAVAGAVLGLGTVLLVTPRLPWRASPDQLPGYAAARGFDPRAGALRLLIFAALPLIAGSIAWRVAGPRRAERPRHVADGRRPRILFAAAVAYALCLWVFLIPLGVRWGHPLVLLGALLAGAVALATALGGGDAEKGAPFLGGATPILPFALLGPRPPSVWLMVGLAGFALPPLTRLCAGALPFIARVARALTLAVLIPGSVAALAAAACMRTPRVADIFEDGHALLPASEYLRGELPYRDIVPGHGLVSDGLLAAAQLRVFGADYAGLKRGEKISGLFFWPAFYALGLGATGSPALALAGLLLTFLFAPQYQLPRVIASLWTVAIALYASRTRKPAAWLACGIALPLCVCVAVEFAVYAAGGVAVALWVARGRRRDHLRRVVRGALVSGGAIALVFAAYGLLGAFVRTTFVFVPALLPVYALGFEHVVPARVAAGLMAGLRDETVLFYAFVTASVVLLGAWLPRAPRVGPRARSVLPISAWAVLAMLSVLERRHTGYGALVVPVGLLLMTRWLRGWRGWASPRSLAAGAALGFFILQRHPVVLLLSVAGVVANPLPPTGAVALSEPPRARGGLFLPGDAALVAATSEMMRRAGLRRDDTWLDFASMPGLYYLFDRDCPIRYYEVGFYETEDAQRDVIAAVERNPRVRVALMSAHAGVIDGLPNAVRAPRVAEFIRERFRPFFREGDVEFWLRKE